MKKYQVKNILQELINKDRELGRVLFWSTSPDDGEGYGAKTNYAFVHDPTLSENGNGNVRTMIGKEEILVRIAIRDLSEIERIGSSMVNYCKNEREKQTNTEVPNEQI